MATIDFEKVIPGGSIEISAPISGYSAFVAELEKQEQDSIREVFAGRKSIVLKGGVEAPAVELIPLPLSAQIEKPSETGETWEQFCKRFGRYGRGEEEIFKLSGIAVIERDFFDTYGPKATLNLIRRQIFEAMVDAMRRAEDGGL